MKRKTTRSIALFSALLTMFAAVPAMGANAADEYDTKDIEPVEITEEIFPDPVLRGIISGPEYDQNGDGILDPNEIIELRNIDCEYAGVKSMKGIEHLTELRCVWCRGNQIEELDVSNLKELQGLWCSENPLKELDITNNSELLWVYCFKCELTELDVSQNPHMAFIEINDNPLNGLDVTSCTELEHLTCGSCGLKKLDLKNNKNLAHLDAMRNQLEELDVTNCRKMKRLDIWDNKGLGSIDVSKCPGLQYYNCSNNDVTKIDVTHNPELVKLACAYNAELEELDLSNNPKLVYLDCAIDGLSELDLSNNPYLYFLQAFTNPFTTLDIGCNPFLIQTYLEGEKKAEYAVCKGHSWTIDYGGDTSTGYDTMYFLCFDDAVELKYDQKVQPPVHEDDPLPDDTSELLTREAAVQVLYEMAGSPDVTGLTTRFTDVEKGSWYEDAVIWGEANSICIGYPYISSDEFGVGKFVNRQDLMLMLMRFTEYMHYYRSIDFGRSDDFIDYFDVDYYAWEAVTWAATIHVMEGRGDPDAPKEERYIAPHSQATRTEFTQMLERMLEKNGIHDPELPAIHPNPDGSGSEHGTGEPPQMPRKKDDSSKPDDKDDNSSKPDDNSSDSSKPDEKDDDSSRTDDSGIMLGDVNGDSRITVTDISKAAAHVKGVKALDDKAFVRADVSGDGMLTVVDISKIAAHVKGVKTIK